MSKEFLIEEIYRWIKEHDGKTPKRDDMKIIEGYPSAYQYEKYFNTRKWNEILEEVGITPSNKMWTKDEESFLQNNWEILSDNEIASQLNKAIGGVKYKRKELRLFRSSQKQFWRDWEIKYLQENFYDAPQEKIEKMLSHRQWLAIRSYATKILKLQRARFAIDNYEFKNVDKINTLYIPVKHKKAWTESDDEYILKNWEIKTDKEMSVFLNRTELAVRKHRQAYLKLCRKTIGNKFGVMNNYKVNKNKIILLSKDKKHRKCKVCKKWFPNTSEYFYKDRNTLRTNCIKCDLQEQKVKRLLSGSITAKMINKMLKKGLSYCSMCNTWRSLDCFSINIKDKRIHSYCSDCKKIEYATKYYGEKNVFKYYERVRKYMDRNGDRCDSLPEQLITNWLIDNNIHHIKQPKYKDYVLNDNSKRRFDWIIYDKRNVPHFVEYFGLWSQQKKSWLEYQYTIKAKKKIKDLYKAGLFKKCIFIFPNDLKNKALDDIFSDYVEINNKDKIKIS